MAAMEECGLDAIPVPMPAPLKDEGISNIPEDDSGLDNSSESGRSCDDDRPETISSNSQEKEETFGSRDSLDADPPLVDEALSMRSKVQQFIDNERDVRIIIHEDLPCRFFERTKDLDEIKRNAAVLEIEETSTVEDNNNGVEDDFENMSPYFRNLLLGKDISADFDVPLDSKPDWLDIEKFKRGQKFARDHLFCINFAEMLALFLIFGVKLALRPLIFTGKSDSPFKAFQRYLSTLKRVMSWYEGDFWGEAAEEGESRRNIAVVKVMHRNLQNKMASTGEDELRRRTTVGGDKTTAVWCTSRKVVLEDFRSSCPVPIPGTCPAYTSSLHVNQLDMAITQFAFVGLTITYPKLFGIHHATDEDLDAFLHMWRGLGHLLGMQDQYNFCNADLETVKARANLFINLTLKPTLREVTPDWEHMCRCLVQGINFYLPLTFESSLRYLCDVINIHAPRLHKSLTFWQSFMYRGMCFSFRLLFRIPGMVAFHNIVLRHAIKKAQDASPEKLAKWEKIQYPYMKQNGSNLQL